MTTIDKSLPVWRVVGHLPAPDGRRMTVFCNAMSEKEARMVGEKEGLGTIESVRFITKEKIAEWEWLTDLPTSAKT